MNTAVIDHDFPPPAAEWRRSGPFLAIAVFLHAAILFYPLKLAIGGDPRQPVNTKDPNRTLDVNDHIINFLNVHTLEEEVVVLMTYLTFVISIFSPNSIWLGFF